MDTQNATIPGKPTPSDKFYLHTEGNFWINLFQRLLDDGYTLFRDETEKLVIRVNPDITYVYDEADDLFFSLKTTTFMENYRVGTFLFASIWTISISNLDFLIFQVPVVPDEAFRLMNWNGTDPAQPKIEMEKTMSKMLSPANVERIFNDCLLTGDDLDDATVAEGVQNTAVLSSTKLEAHRKDIEEMFSDLPQAFFEGSGASFLAADTTESGEQWTGDHNIVEKLFLLGIGLGIAEIPVPKDMWFMLPEEMPYITVNLS